MQRLSQQAKLTPPEGALVHHLLLASCRDITILIPMYYIYPLWIHNYIAPQTPAMLNVRIALEIVEQCKGPVGVAIAAQY
ncbi:hypothetical protein K474DRAFT_819829 [Panus rudis PR-1116 ss-1]|nr:hypothetical protein K474DRAFT_819829 [Panus rudis PR-1116 ss-1]